VKQFKAISVIVSIIKWITDLFSQSRCVNRFSIWGGPTEYVKEASTGWSSYSYEKKGRMVSETARRDTISALVYVVFHIGKNSNFLIAKDLLLE
jgi:hypothetical protein